jgi:hypothetical protein
MATGWGKRVRVDIFHRNVVNDSPTTLPTTWWASLNTGNPGDDGQTANEVTTTTSGYARQQITGGAPSEWTITAYTSLSNDDASIVGNNNALSFGPSAGVNAAWGTITYVGLWSASTGTTEATYFGRAAAAVSQAVAGAGVTITIAVNGIQMSLDSV